MVDVWNKETMPQDWNIGLICSIYKKGHKLDRRNYGGITLLNVAYKIFTNIHYGRIQPYTEKVLQSYQCGFGPRKSTVNQIYAI
jgi:sorting nexin-29